MRYIEDLATSGFLKEYKCHHNVVKAIQYDGVFLVSGSYDQHIHAHNVKTDKTMFNYQGGRVFSLQFDEHKIIFGDDSKRLRQLDFTSPPTSHTHKPQNVRAYYIERMNEAQKYSHTE